MSNEENNGSSGTLQFDEAECERYLFGEMSEAEQEDFETAYFNDDAFFERFAAVKNDLLDLYVRDQLEPAKRARMEPHFLATPARRRQIAGSSEFVRSLTAIADRDRAAAAPVVSEGLFERILGLITLPRLAGATAVVLAIVGTFFFLDRSRPSQPDDRLADQQPPPAATPASGIATPSPAANVSPEIAGVEDPEPGANKPAENPNQRSRPSDRRRKRRDSAGNPQSSQKSFALSNSNNSQPYERSPAIAIAKPATITLHPGSTRGGTERNTLTLPEAQRNAPARIDFAFRGEKYSAYIVTISSVDSAELVKINLRGGNVKTSQEGLRVLPVFLKDARLLTAGGYIAKLEGRSRTGKTETIEEYYFQVRRLTNSPTPIRPDDPTKKP